MMLGCEQQGAGYNLGGWDDRGDPEAAGEALVSALRAQEDQRAISRGAAGVNALCGLPPPPQRGVTVYRWPPDAAPGAYASNP